MKGRVGFVGVLMVLTVVSCCSYVCGQSPPRNFRMGFTDTSPTIRQRPSDYVYSYIRNNGDLYMEHVPGFLFPWCDFLPGRTLSAATAIQFQSLRAKRNSLGLNLKYYVYIAMTGEDGPPDGLCRPAADFANPSVRSAFVRYVQYLVQVLNPDYLTIGVEVNGYAISRPADFPNLVSLYKEAYRAAKALRPTMPIFPSLMLGVMFDFIQWDLIRQFEPETDAIGLTFYGHQTITTDNLPFDWVSKVYEYTSKPIVISETGFLSQSVQTPDGTLYRGSTQEQTAFLQRMVSEAEKLDALFYIWYMVADIWAFIPALPPSLQPVAMRFEYDGLRTWPDTLPKPAEAVFRSTFTRPLQEERPPNRFTYSVPVGGVQNLKSFGGATEMQVGSFLLSPNPGSPLPAGPAGLSFRKNGILVMETNIPPSPLTTRWLGFVQSGTDMRMGASVSNTANQMARLVLDLLSADGAAVLATTSITLPPYGQAVKYIDEFPTTLPADFQGLLRVTSDQSVVGAIWKTSLTSRGDAIVAMLPPIDLNGPPGPPSLTFPYIVNGGGYATQLVLINPTSQPISGLVQFAGGPGIPIPVTIGSVTDIQFPYLIPPYGVTSLKTAGTGDVNIIYATINPDPGLPAPAASALFSSTQAGILISEIGISSTPPLSSGRLYLDFNSATNSIVLSIVNPNNSPAQLSMYLVDKNGNRVGAGATALTLGPGEQSLRVITDLIPSIPNVFQGMLHIDSNQPVSAINVRQRLTEQGDYLMLAHSAVDWTRPPTGSMLVYPGVINGNGYRTQIILMNPTAAALSGSVSFLTPAGDLRRLGMRESSP